jgi:hypothetical protein
MRKLVLVSCFLLSLPLSLEASTSHLKYCEQLMGRFFPQFYPHLADRDLLLREITGLESLLERGGMSHKNAFIISPLLERFASDNVGRTGAVGDVAREIYHLVQRPSELIFFTTSNSTEISAPNAMTIRVPNALGLGEPLFMRQAIIMNELGHPFHPASPDFVAAITNIPNKSKLPARIVALIPPFIEPREGIPGWLPAILGNILAKSDAELFDRWESANAALPEKHQDWLFKSTFVRKTKWGPLIEPAFLAVFNISRSLAFMPYIEKTPSAMDLAQYKKRVGSQAMTLVGKIFRHWTDLGYPPPSLPENLVINEKTVLDFGEKIATTMKYTIE